MLADELHDEQFEPAPSYVEVMLQHYRNCIKDFVDWFLIAKRNLLIKRCRLAASISGLRGDAWQDLLSECCIEAYRIGERFDPYRGNLEKFLLSSLWRFPFRNNNVERYRMHSCDQMGEIAFEEIDTNTIAMSTIAEVDLAERKYTEVTSVLSMEERALLQLHFGLGLSRVTIAQFLNRGESTIRSRLNVILGKIKVSGVGYDE